MVSLSFGNAGSKGAAVCVGPAPEAGADPDFVVVIALGDIREPLDHFGFQCETREAVAKVAERARTAGTLVKGPVDAGGSVGYFVLIREPSGHLVGAERAPASELQLTS